jgi:streptogramin lyase
MNTKARIGALAALALALALSAGGASAATPTIKEFAIPGGAAAYPLAIEAGPDGNLWFTESFANQIGRIDPGGHVTEFSVPADADLSDVVPGPDGNLWFTEYGARQIGRMSLSGGEVKEFPVPNGQPASIAPGPDGNLWFTTSSPARVDRITTSGVVTEFAVPSSEFLGQIIAGPDGNLWFTEPYVNIIGRITTAGVITEFPISTPGRYAGIAAGPDGNLWFTAYDANKIVRLTPTGSITEFSVPKEDGGLGAIVAGSDGGLWYTDDVGNEIGRITTNGVVTDELPVPTPDAGVFGDIAAGPDGNVWFTEVYAGQIGRVNMAAAGHGYVLENAGGFTPRTRNVPQGATVDWSFYGPSQQRVVDRSGMGLFGTAPLPPVSYYSFAFEAAGTYPYSDPPNAQAGTIAVPLKAKPASGTETTTFTITSSAQAASPGYVFDVQILRPTGQEFFADWKTGRTARSAKFVPDDGPGVYYFRSRLRNTGNGKSSGWSPPASIAVQ